MPRRSPSSDSFDDPGLRVAKRVAAETRDPAVLTKFKKARAHRVKAGPKPPHWAPGERRKPPRALPVGVGSDSDNDNDLGSNHSGSGDDDDSFSRHDDDDDEDHSERLAVKEEQVDEAAAKTARKEALRLNLKGCVVTNAATPPTAENTLQVRAHESVSLKLLRAAPKQVRRTRFHAPLRLDLGGPPRTVVVCPPLPPKVPKRGTKKLPPPPLTPYLVAPSGRCIPRPPPKPTVIWFQIYEYPREYLKGSGSRWCKKAGEETWENPGPFFGCGVRPHRPPWHCRHHRSRR